MLAFWILLKRLLVTARWSHEVYGGEVYERIVLHKRVSRGIGSTNPNIASQG